MEYKNKKSLDDSIRNNRLCRKCSQLKRFENPTEREKYIGKNNPFYGKKHNPETIKQIHEKRDKSFFSDPLYKKKISSYGENNGMYKKSNYEHWLSKYGKEEADIRLEEFKAKISKATSGKNNPMYGKPSPQGSGNGWSGWYKGIYFRSLLELSFLVNWVDRFNLKIENAECKKYRIHYDFNGSGRNYFADWVINEKYLIEIKPKKLWSTPQNKAKFEATKEYCKENNLIFKIIEPIKLTKEDILVLYETKQIIFNKKYEEKIKNYNEI